MCFEESILIFLKSSILPAHYTLFKFSDTLIQTMPQESITTPAQVLQSDLMILLLEIPIMIIRRLLWREGS